MVDIVGSAERKYLMVIMMGGFSGFIWMDLANALMAEAARKTLLRWCAILGVPRARVSDTVKPLKNRALGLVAATVNIAHPVY